MTRAEPSPPTELALLEPPPGDDQLVEEALGEIRRLWSQGLLMTVVKVGDYLIEKFYGGSVQEARSRQPRKAAALGKLLERAEELPVSVHALKQSVRIAVQYHELPRKLAENLSKTQHEALLPVGDSGQKLALAREAVTVPLSTRELIERVKGETETEGRVGRPRLPPVLRRVGAVFRVLEAPGLDEEILPDSVEELDPQAVGRMLDQVRRARASLDRISAALQTRAAPPAPAPEASHGLAQRPAPAEPRQEPLHEGDRVAGGAPPPEQPAVAMPSGPKGALLATLPGPDAEVEVIIAWVLQALDSLTTPELAAVLKPMAERVAEAAKKASGHNDRRVRRRLRNLVEQVASMDENEARRIRKALSGR